MRIDDFISIAEVDDGAAIAGQLFARKYGVAIPDFPHHIVAFYRSGDGAQVPLCYIHLTDCGDILLVGGACSDDRVLRRMRAEEREILREVGGIFRYGLHWSTRTFADRFAAVFGYSGDLIARRESFHIDFEPAEGDKHLLVCWTQPASELRRRQMIAKARAFAPF